MQLATIEMHGEAVVVARSDDNQLVPLDVDALTAGYAHQLPASAMKRLIAAWDPQRARSADALLTSGGGQSVSPDDVSWLPPILDPGKICGVAMNNSASNGRKIKAPDHPAFFLKPPSSMVAHGKPVVVRSYYGSVHPEPELAVVMGSTMRDVEPEQVNKHVFGYTIVNDITGNGMRAQDMFHYYALYPDPDHPDELRRVEQHLSYAARYKGTDTFCAVGPWITTADCVPDPDNLDVVCHLNDEKIAEDSTRFYNYKVAEVLSFLSYFQTLHAGDIVSLGTAFKPGATRKSIHHANFQQVGGPVSVEIESLGRQENPVVVEQQTLGRWRLKEAN